MNVHIALMGVTKEPVLKGFRSYENIDRLYVLHSPDSKEFKFKKEAQDVQARLKAIGFGEVFLKEIDAFDMSSVVDTIMEIAEQEKGNQIFINITGGTNLMAGAACAASFFLGANAYYVLDEKKLPRGTPLKDQIVELPVPNIPYFQTLGEMQRNILGKLWSLGGKASGAQLREEMSISPQKLKYHIWELAKKRLISVRRGWEEKTMKEGESITKTDTRKLAIELTNSGKLMLSWTNP
jgi:hypothetical protein